MIHVTTEIGRPGKKEREKLHFPEIDNRSGMIHTPKARGRKRIPYENEGREQEWRPCNQSVDLKYTYSGPDWSSKLKYIPTSDYLKYPAAEIWPTNWKSIRPYPYTYRRSEKEWLLDPTCKRIRCLFDGVHKASATSDNEITHTMMFGRGRHEDIIDKRNELPAASPGDKSYQVPEYSPSFYKTSTDNALPRFRETFREKMEQKHINEEVDEVKRLEIWQPAKPISSTIPQLDSSSELKKC